MNRGPQASGWPSSADIPAECAALLDLTSDAVFVRRADDDVLTYWNAGAERLYGFGGGHALGRRAGELLGTVWPQGPESVRESLERGERWEGELRQRTADGRELIVVSRQALHRDADGTPHAILEANTDITELQRHARELAAGAARVAAIENLPDGSLLIFDGDLRYVEVGGETIRALGLVRAELIGARADEVAARAGFDAEATARMTSAYRAAIDGRVAKLELDAQGRTLDLRVVPLDLADGVRFGMVLGIDVTERRRHERERAVAEARWRAAIDNLPGGSLLVFDSDLCYVEVGGDVLRLVGLTREQMIGRHVGISGDRELAERIQAAHKDALEGRSSELEFDLRGQTLYARVVSLTLADGARYGMMLCIDVTEHRRLEERLRQVEKLEAVGQLAGGVAHDFNNLLTAISGYCALAREAVGDGDGGEELQEIARAAERAEQLTGQLLAFSRQQVLRPVALDVGEVARELLPMLRRLIRENIRIALQTEDGLPPVCADRGQLEQVIMNLAVNGRDAMPSGGTLTIETRAPTGAERSARADGESDRGESVWLVVSDTGTGMAPEVIAHVFEPFFTTKEPGRGTGLGLATVHGIVTQTGGHVTIDSRPGAGTTVTITLPAAEHGAEVVDAADSQEPDRVDGDETILICEDEPSVRRLIELLLTNHGYSALSADHPSQALALAAAHPGRIDALISDIVMPDMPGPELAQRLHALRPGLRVVFVSGYAPAALRGSSTIPDDSGFVQKPFQALELLGALRRLLDHDNPTGARQTNT